MALDDSYAARVRRALAQQVPEVVPAADAARLAGLGVALALQSAQQVTLTLNRGRNVAKYGPASSQVADMDARLAANAQMTQALQEAQVRAQRQAPTVPDGAAAVFGGVVDADGTGIAKAIVVAMNAAGAPAARAESAADGSYQLIVPVSANSSTGLAPAEGAMSPSVTLRLEVLVDGKGVLASGESLTLYAGEIVMRDLAVTTPTPSAPGPVTKLK